MMRTCILNRTVTASVGAMMVVALVSLAGGAGSRYSRLSRSEARVLFADCVLYWLLAPWPSCRHWKGLVVAWFGSIMVCHWKSSLPSTPRRYWTSASGSYGDVYTIPMHGTAASMAMPSLSDSATHATVRYPRTQSAVQHGGTYARSIRPCW